MVAKPFFEPLFSSGTGSNSYLIGIKKEASVLIDGGIEVGVILRTLKKLETSLLYLIHTHCHFDHLIFTKKIAQQTGCEVVAHYLDAKAMEEGNEERILFSWFTHHKEKYTVHKKVEDGEIITLGKNKNLTIKVLHTPGHTPGSICLYIPTLRALFTGDTVFADGVGRVDIPGGNAHQLKSSLKKLITFCKHNPIEKFYPGHGREGNVQDIEHNYLLYFS